MTDQLRIDLGALSRVLPQLKDLAEQVKADILEQLSADQASDEVVPSLAAAQQMSTSTLPALKRKVRCRAAA